MRAFHWLSMLIVVVAGCGGTARTTPDAAGDLSDAWVAPADDAWTASTEDAWVAPGDDAWTAPAGDAGSGACTDDPDEAVSNGATFSDDLGNCAMNHLSDPGLMTCIVGLGLSTPCAACFDAQVHCTVMHCALPCAGGDSPGCTTCRANNCDAAFAACSGFSP